MPRDMLLYVYISDESICLHKTNTICSCMPQNQENNLLKETNSNHDIALHRSENEETFRKYQACLKALEELQVEHNNLLEKHKILYRMKSNHLQLFSENDMHSQLQTPQSVKRFI